MWCDANAILEFVSFTLRKIVDLQHQAIVLQTVWSDPITATYLAESFRLSAQIKAQKEVIADLVRSLSKVKNTRSKAELVMKYAVGTRIIGNTFLRYSKVIKSP